MTTGDEVREVLVRLLADESDDGRLKRIGDLGFLDAVWQGPDGGEILTVLGVELGRHGCASAAVTALGRVGVGRALGECAGEAALIAWGPGSAWSVDGDPGLRLDEDGLLHGELVAEPAGPAAVAAARFGGRLVWVRARVSEGEAVGATERGMVLSRLRFAGEPAEIVARDEQAQDLWAELGRRLPVVAAAILVGIAWDAVDRGVEHARARAAFGRPLGTQQAVAHRCAEMYTEVAACDALVWVAGRALDAGRDAEIRRLAHAAKGRASATLPGVVESAILVHGASGFAEETGLGRAWRRAITLAAGFGTAAQHRAAVAGSPGRAVR
jgi:hypothetical protein